ncbi:MAG: Do family serine endopeptidase [Candidatus Marinimicrobia bacterium]|jgi:serine protease Do|nr:Do family serine endopeptidase [Candidatus Neomarinimicrobiota bacterium]MBT3631668.1 Do family serine endopeptidase [Candidatus Neomarinimicrobiota bacterium]MBT3825869.1 Do family serine endopeptidase [Candidatus Neomarinimicrobiota bacterium]MBT4129966.1 Do family serine endopeptidase [Candidatus Neomarinimicrobiota bacterium]MBT4296048.1 Do family serine endopeptidase [Candidatus Neomarinimicrobiota bacterium]
MKKHMLLITPLILIALLIPTDLNASDIGVAKALSNAFADIAEEVSPSVVTITSEHVYKHPAMDQYKGFQDMLPKQLWPFLPDGDREMKSTSLGSGIIISKDGYILTNNHVVEKGENIKVKIADNKEYDAEIIGADPKTDVALIKVNAKNLKPIKLGDSDKIRVGEWVLAVGSPFSGSLSQTVTQGIVSATGRSSVGLNDYENFIQTDAAINPGNSGGALVNLDGELVGMNSAIASRSGGYQGIGFAIPVNLVNRIVEDLRANGRVTRAWLGVYVQPVDAAMAKTLGMDIAKGALIQQVVDGSPADDADLKQLDVIIEFDGHDVENSRKLPILVSTQRPNEKKKLKVLRDGKVKTITVKLGELPDEVTAAGPLEAEESDIGLTVETASAERLRFYNLSPGSQGVLITSVDRNSEAYKKNLRTGHLIQKMGPNVRNLSKVSTFGAFEKNLRDYNPGDTILLLVRRDNSNTFFVALTIPES